MQKYINKANDIIKEVKKIVIGKDKIIKKVLTTILAKGNILIEDIPGVGKTTLALAFSKAMSLDCKRLQFTPDVLPSDILGFSIYNKDLDRFEYKQGAIMCNLFLADEINRTSAKTQSALLEVMEEGKVTIDGITRKVSKPFIVIATQNPVGSIGTQMLPESQLDRFMIKLTMGYPDMESEIEVLKGKQKKVPLDEINTVVTKEDILVMQDLVENIYIHEKIYEYIVTLISKTRNHPLIDLGVSPRGSVALTKLAKATAFLKNRDYVVPEDIQEIFKDVTIHRIILNTKARISNTSEEKILLDILNSVSVPGTK
ncbi:MAG: AAA family ATPase [Clostridium sp.]|jgi:MoxR-like ATPase|nr:MoxR family ATPase [Clostridium sp.]